jgi:GxxExxY protein
MQSTKERVWLLARDVYRSLGSGHSEKVYDSAMQVGLRLDGIKYESQKVVELKYRGFCVGEGYPDLIVRSGRERIVVELKAVGGELGAAEEQQLKNYLKILGLRQGLLINFQQPGKSQRKTKIELKEVLDLGFACTRFRAKVAYARSPVRFTKTRRSRYLPRDLAFVTCWAANLARPKIMPELLITAPGHNLRAAF